MREFTWGSRLTSGRLASRRLVTGALCHPLAAGDDSDEAQKLKEGAIQRLCELYVSQR